MSLFRFNFDKAGPGVDKDTPPKKGIARWWEIFTRDLSALLLGNLALFICALPMMASVVFFYLTSMTGQPWVPALLLNILFAVPLGPALAAMHRLTMQSCRDVPYFAWHEFKKAYKQDFKQGAIAMVILTVMGDLILFSMCMLPWMEEVKPVHVGMLLLGCYIWFSMINTVFQQIALIEMKLSAIFKNSVVLVVAAGWRGVVVTLMDIAVLIFILAYGQFFVPLALFGFFGVMIMTTDLIFWPRFEQLFIKREKPQPRQRRSARQDWQAVADAEGKKEQKPSADEEWAKAFLAERAELDADETEAEVQPAGETAGELSAEDPE